MYSINKSANFVPNSRIQNKNEPITVEFRKVFLALPACFLAGVLAGISFMML